MAFVMEPRAPILAFKNVWIALFLALPLFHTQAAQDTKAFLFAPQANRDSTGLLPGTDHARFFIDYDSLLSDLSARGINTIIYYTDYLSFRFKNDPKLASIIYPAYRGFDSSETRLLTRMARSRNMKVMICMSIVTHQDGCALSRAYPEYLLKEMDWVAGTYYPPNRYVEHNGKVYICSAGHTASTNNEPGVGSNWSASWRLSFRHLRNPFNAQAEQLVFGMIDEVIDAFTVDGKEPEAFHVASDEGWDWQLLLNCPDACSGKTHAEAFAMSINNAYGHIKSNHPAMNVIMWGDMLDSLWNGGRYNTSNAVDLIPKDIIIADWRYEANKNYGYDPISGLFPSVRRFAQKGFTVLPSSWMTPSGSAALIWTGNMVEAQGGKIAGHIYTTWFGNTVPQLRQAFHNPADTTLFVYAHGIAKTIDSTINLIGVAACPQTDCFCGSYPNCQNTSNLDGLNGNEYRDYYCHNGSPAYRIIPPPQNSGCVAYWDFEGDANDRVGSNHGTLKNGAQIGFDPIRGRYLNLDGLDDYVLVPDSPALKMTAALSVSLWFSPAESLAVRQVLVGKDYREYELVAYPKGDVTCFTSNGDPAKYEYGMYSVGPRNWGPNKWHHLVWSLDGKQETLILNGRQVVSGATKIFVGTLAGTHEFDIGRRVGGGLNFKGRIDDVMLFNRALSPAEADYLYKQQNPNSSVSPRLETTNGLAFSLTFQPLSHKLIVNNTTGSGTVKASIRNIRGQTIAARIVHGNEIVFDTQKLPLGIYLVTIGNELNLSRKRIFVGK